ncbi:MAG: isoaspartyl peptidase/L-asparaginase, partial [Myxococcota bacterium]
SLRADGSTIEMDAAVMDSTGRFAAVGAIREVRHPVRVARALLDSAPRILVGPGAVSYARSLGMAAHDPSSEPARQRYRARSAGDGAAGAGVEPAVRATAPQATETGPAAPASPQAPASPVSSSPNTSTDASPDTSVDTPVSSAVEPAATGAAPGAAATDAAPAAAGVGSRPDAAPGADTVAVLVRSADGRFAGAISSGGPDLSPLGRIGDAVIPGAGLYVGPHGAVAITGDGDALSALGLARAVYERMAAGESPEAAAAGALDLVPAGLEVGVIAIDGTASAAAATRPMAWAASDHRGRSGPADQTAGDAARDGPAQSGEERP